MSGPPSPLCPHGSRVPQQSGAGGVHGGSWPELRRLSGALLPCLPWLAKVPRPKKPQEPDLHQQEDFLWKDLLVVTMIVHRKMDSETPSSESSPFLKRC
nr:IQ motif and SEC7 domain-containing protein 1 [Oryctolagus cuniculus]